MAQYNKFSKVEKKYYNHMIGMLKKFFIEKGFKQIKHINTVGQPIDRENGVDCKFILDGKEINVAFRCRENCNFRDITIRRTASDSGNPTEIHKIQDGSYLANIYLYCWFNTRINQVEYCIVNMKKLTHEKIMANTKEWQINVDDDGKPDGSTFYPIGVYDIRECISYHNIKKYDFLKSKRK